MTTICNIYGVKGVKENRAFCLIGKIYRRPLRSSLFEAIFTDFSTVTSPQWFLWILPVKEMKNG